VFTNVPGQITGALFWPQLFFSLNRQGVHRMKIVCHSHLKNTLTVFTFILVAGLCQSLQADSTIHPVKMDKAQIAGGIFQDHEPVVATHDGNTTYDVEVFLSSNKQFDAGMYKSGKVRAEITEPYGVHEYMHFLEGGVTLTSSDGTVTEVMAGDSVVIPAEWTGIWDTQGYTKIYVIYSPGGPIEE
jgi:uncharacterized cupin superfamily protein